MIDETRSTKSCVHALQPMLPFLCKGGGLARARESANLGFVPGPPLHPVTSHLPSLSFSSLICKVGITVLASKDHGGTEPRVWTQDWLGSHPGSPWHASNTWTNFTAKPRLPYLKRRENNV